MVITRFVRIGGTFLGYLFKQSKLESIVSPTSSTFKTLSFGNKSTLERIASCFSTFLEMASVRFTGILHDYKEDTCRTHESLNTQVLAPDTSLEKV